MPRKHDCLDCGQCESCIERAMDYAAEQEEAGLLMECPYCDEGWQTGHSVSGDRISIECPECGGTGWY